VLIGTSGFAYLHWNGAFYPAGLPAEERLAWYARRFRTVELNVSFYRTPPAKTFAKWRDEVPHDFRFAVKASRYLTHVLRLRHPREPVEYLMERAGQLGDKLGPVLIQLPPDLPVELERLDDTIAAFGPGVALAVEPRHASWFTPELRALMERRGVALCIADRRGPISPIVQTTSWLYVRLHEGRAAPPSCYGRAALAAWARRLVALGGPDPPGYAFFNNDAGACATRNAIAFERAMARAGAELAAPPGVPPSLAVPRLQAATPPMYSDAASGSR
jgi:uncharacterized protein YecE (DUF72 family)